VVANDPSTLIIKQLLPVVSTMPRKIRELKSLLLKAGFIQESGKGSHTKWSHFLLPGKLILSGKDGSDAKLYQERDVETVVQRLAELQSEEDSHE